MRRYWEFSLISLLIFAVAPPPHAIAGPTRAVRVNAYDTQPEVQRTRIYIHSATADTKKFSELRRRLVEGGAVHVNYFEPSLVVCEVPMTSPLSKLLADPEFSYFEESFVGPQMASPASEEINRIKAAYDRVEAVLDVQKSGKWQDGFFDLVLEVPPDVVRESRRPRQVDGSAQLVAAPGVQQGSEMMIGNIHVNTIYPESDFRSPNTENWTDDELRDVSQGVITAMLAFQQTWAYISINFAFSFYNKVPTRYEPILHTLDDDFLWIADCVANLPGGGFTGRNELLAVHDLNNSKRGGPNGPDWVFTIFVADGSAEGGKFRGAPYTAYAQLGGPYNVMPFPTNPLVNPNNLDPITLFANIMMHETIHIFWGLDEYPLALSDCKSRSGYLNYQNRNKVDYPPGSDVLTGCPTFVDCIMWNARTDQGKPLCFYTAGQVGTVDANENDIPDIFDMPPTVEFEGGPRDTIEVSSYTLNMKAISVPVPNRNPFQSERVDYAAPLKSASFIINGVGLTFLEPLDGKWDETEEDLRVRLSGLSPGKTTIRIGARNTLGRFGFVIKEIYFIGINYALVGVTVTEGGLNVTWSTIGETFGADYSLVRIDYDTGTPDTTTYDSSLFTESTDGVFITHRYLDSDVKSGRTYRYTVKANYDYNGQLKEFFSREVEARAMLQIEAGSRMSSASPNPFRDATQITLDIPSVFALNPQGVGPAGGNTFQNVVPTSVSIAIYDALGRQVKEVYRGQMFAQKETFTWDGTNGRGERVPSGVYFIRAQAGDIIEVKKVVVVR